MNESAQSFLQRTLVATGVVLSAALLVLLVWYAVDVFLLAFAGILLAIFLRSLADWICRHTSIPGSWSLVLVVVGLVCVLGFGSWLLAPSISDQIDVLAETLPRSVRQLQERIGEYEWGHFIFSHAPEPRHLVAGRADVLSRVTGFFSTTLGVLVDLIVVLFTGLYVAADPKMYISGFIRLFPMHRRERVRVVLIEVGGTLRWWLIGKMISMTVVGVLTVIGLWLLGVPLALVLGIIASLLTFIPNIGPILSVIPAALLALSQSPVLALYVLLLYLGIQIVESYLITPIVQQQTVSLPPALIIFSQLLLGLLVGGLGLVVATPLAAAALVLVKMVYVEDTLGDRLEQRQA